MTRNRIVVLFCVLALMAVTAVGAWVAGSGIVSPAEAAARTAPPTPSPILVPIEQRVLSSEIITRGTARFGLPQPIALAPSPLKVNMPGLITTLPPDVVLLLTVRWGFHVSDPDLFIVNLFPISR